MIKTIRRLLLDLFTHFFGGHQSPGSSRDPYAGRPVPKKRGPQDRSAAVAVAEPDE